MKLTQINVMIDTFRGIDPSTVNILNEFGDCPTPERLDRFLTTELNDWQLSEGIRDITAILKKVRSRISHSDEQPFFALLNGSSLQEVQDSLIKEVLRRFDQKFTDRHKKEDE